MEHTLEQNAWLEEIKIIEQTEHLLERNRLALYFQKGRLLSKLKNSLPHGQFLPLLKAGGLKMSARNAQRLMELAANEELIRANAPDLADMTIEKALAIIKHQTEGSDKTVKQSAIVSARSVESYFDKNSQSYLIITQIAAEDVDYLKINVNHHAVCKQFKQVLEKLPERKVLTDMSTVSAN